jgi:hypothetical protein
MTMSHLGNAAPETDLAATERALIELDREGGGEAQIGAVLEAFAAETVGINTPEAVHSMTLTAIRRAMSGWRNRRASATA